MSNWHVVNERQLEKRSCVHNLLSTIAVIWISVSDKGIYGFYLKGYWTFSNNGDLCIQSQEISHQEFFQQKNNFLSLTGKNNFPGFSLTWLESRRLQEGTIVLSVHETREFYWECDLYRLKDIIDVYFQTASNWAALSAEAQENLIFHLQRTLDLNL